MRFDSPCSVIASWCSVNAHTKRATTAEGTLCRHPNRAAESISRSDGCDPENQPVDRRPKRRLSTGAEQGGSQQTHTTHRTNALLRGRDAVHIDNALIFDAREQDQDPAIDVLTYGTR